MRRIGLAASEEKSFENVHDGRRRVDGQGRVRDGGPGGGGGGVRVDVNEELKFL